MTLIYLTGPAADLAQILLVLRDSGTYTTVTVVSIADSADGKSMCLEVQ